MAGYTPGEQPAIGQRVVKLNTNENPFPPSPKVLAALSTIQGEMLRRYPSPKADAFRKAAAELHGVSMDHILAGNGSDDILSIAVRTFVAPGKKLVCPDPTYSLYPVLAQISEAKYEYVPWADGWQLPIDALLAAEPKAIFFANPNAPTGTINPRQRIEELARRFDGVVLVDEAYADFAEENCIDLVNEHENIVICRTLSKAYSLAGLRFGYAIAQPQVITEMMKVKDSYNCDAIAIALATAAIQDQAYARQTWEHVRKERQRVADALAGMGCTVLPSHANFLLAAVPGGDGQSMYLGLKRQGILVRYFDRPGLRDKVRISIGTTQENDALLAGIREVLSARAECKV